MDIMFNFRWNFEEGRPSSNFDTFPIALLTVFQVPTLKSLLLISYWHTCARVELIISLNWPN